VSQPAGFEGLDHRLRIDEGAAPGVDQHGPGLHAREGGAVQEVSRLRGQRAVQADDVGRRQQVREKHVRRPQRETLGTGHGIEGQHATAEPGEDPCDGGSDLPGAHHSRRAADEIEAEQAIQREVALADARPGAVHLAVESEDEGDGVLGHRVRRVGGHAGDGQGEARRRGQIDVVVAGRAQRDQARPFRGQPGEHLRVELVVHERADGGQAGGQGRRLLPAARLQEEEIVPAGPVGRGQERDVVGLRAEDGHAHVASIARGCGAVT